MYETVEAEQKIICGLLARQNAIEDVYGMLSPEMFEIGVYGSLYREIRKAFDVKKEITVEELKQNVEAVGYRRQEIDDALMDCIKSGGMAYQVAGNATVVANHYKKTCVERVIQRAELKEAEIDGQIDKLIGDLESLRGGESADAQTVAEITEKYKDKYFKDESKPRALLEIDDLDSLIGGFEGGDLIIIGARPAVGKSALVTQWAELFAGFGLKVGFYNLEMTSKQMFERFVAAKSGIETTRLRMATRFLNDEEERYKRAVEELETHDHLYISTGAKKVSEIRQDVRRMQYDIVIVDYLQLLVADARYQGNRAAEVGYISAQLKRIATDFSIPVIALSQLNRLSEGRQGKEPSMSELREAGNLEQDASVIILLWNRDETDPSKKGLKVEKSRQGKTGKVDMIFDGSHMKWKPEHEETPFG